jgi:hypothetical protein
VDSHLAVRVAVFSSRHVCAGRIREVVTVLIVFVVVELNTTGKVFDEFDMGGCSLDPKDFHRLES